ncbi:MAG: biotin/lipoyl-binding protein [Lachnospiraceae bacterium]|nr:biotin/lipoyl-binding protein [Lachnospiraceae bacterium]
MKSYTVTVNGVAYEVTVEEHANGSAQSVQSAPVAPVAVPKAAEKKAASSNEGSIKIASPMPGKILSIKANVGASVKKGDVVLLLEAMKMENEITASEDGTIASINVSVGQEVEAGTVLVTLN